MVNGSKPGVDWDHIQQRYEAGDTPGAIARSGVGVSRQAIQKRVNRQGWKQDPAQRAFKDRQRWLAVAAPPPTGNGNSGGLKRYHGKDTPEARAQILATLERGATLELAAKAAGISEATLHNWKNADPLFMAQIEAARCGHAIEHIGVIDHAGRNNHDWKASAHLLAKNPLTKADYGDTAKAGGPAIQVVLNVQCAGDEPETITIEASE